MRRAYGIMFVATGLALWAAGSAGGAFPGGNGKIAFVRGSVVETIEADGSGLATLVANGTNPAWSPDGKKVAFSRGCRIFVAQAVGTGEQALTRGRQCDRDPDWSPAGDSLVFTRRVARRGSAQAVALYVMQADGSAQRRLTQRSLTRARLKRIKYWAVDSGPSWSSSDLIAFARNNAIYVVRANGGGLRRLTRPSSTVSHLHPDWSPDGRTLAFTKRFRGTADDVYLIEADGTRERALSTEVGGSNSTPAWSPDGSFVCVYIGFHDLYANVLAIVGRDGSLVRVLQNGRGDAPDWQPLPSG